jgi:hypothetical protein
MYADTEASVRVGLSAGEESSVSMFTLKYAQAHYARKNHTQTHTHTALYVPRVVSER